MVVLVLIAAVPPVCALLGWICWLRFARHVYDTGGPDAFRHLPAVARAYRARSVREAATGPPEPPA